MHHRSLAILSALSISALAVGQNPLGTFFNTGTTFATRGGAAVPNTNPCVLFVRHDVEHYVGLTDGVIPNVHEIVGGSFVIQDQNLSTQDTFNLIAYTADPNQPNYPDVANPLATTGNLVLPAGTGGGAYSISVNFTTPITAPGNQDFYIGLQFNSGWVISGNQVTDGLSVWEIRAQAPTSPGATQDWDEPGAGIATASPDDRFGGYYCANPVTGPDYPVQTQYKIQPLVPVAGGVASTLTNQTNHDESTAGAVAGFSVQQPGAGTSCMFSGLYPDAASPAAHPGRLDRIGQMFEEANLPAGSPVFFLIDLGPFPSQFFRADAFVPGSTGVSCLNLATMQVLSFTVTGNNGRAFFVSDFPAAVRPLLSGVDWLQQAVGVDLATNTLIATACTRQRT